MIQRFTAEIAQCSWANDLQQWIPGYTIMADVVMNPQGNLEVESVRRLKYDGSRGYMDFTDVVHVPKGKRFIFDREGICISHHRPKPCQPHKWVHLWNIKNVNPAFPNNYPQKKK